MTPDSAKRVWFITGCSTGFGRLLAEQVLAHGDCAVATARNPARIMDLETNFPQRAQALQLDVTDRAQARAAVDQAIASFGRIDVLVNNAGYGLVAAQEEATEEQIRRQVETNVFGVIHVTQAALPHLRAQRSGHIVNLSSVAGLVGTAGLGYYNLTKFALEGMSEALALELAPFGIRVTAVEPGPFRTQFAGSVDICANEMPEYAESAGMTRAMLRSAHGTQKGDPLRAVQAIQQIVASPNPPGHLLLGAFALNKFRRKLDALQSEMADWESVTLGADFPDEENARATA